jgi:hypothetical protein
MPSGYPHATPASRPVKIHQHGAHTAQVNDAAQCSRAVRDDQLNARNLRRAHFLPEEAPVLVLDLALAHPAS